MRNYVQDGNNLTVPAPAAIESGDGVVVGSMFGVATGDAASGDDVTLRMVGVVELPKVSAQAWTVGAIIYWDSGSSQATTASSGNTKIGVAVEAAANPSDNGVVRLNGSF